MKLLKFSALVLASVVLTACSQDVTSQNISTTEPVQEVEPVPENNIFPITITHAFGETTIESQPQRVATLGWRNEDTPLALGIVPVGMPLTGQIDGELYSWTQQEIATLGGDYLLYDGAYSYNLDDIASTNPDIILGAYGGMTAEQYAELSEIAPVIAYKGNEWQTLWRDQISTNARAIGLEQEGYELIDTLNSFIQEKVQEYPDIKGKNAVFCMMSGYDLTNFVVYSPADPRAAFLLDLGLYFPDAVHDILRDSSDMFITINSGNIDLLNEVDIIVTYGEEGLLEILQENYLTSTIPAVQNGAVAVIENDSDISFGFPPSALSLFHTLDDILDVINTAAQKLN
ncbi:MAG: hypothetical protein ATN35_03750 [Epulopiscium sp. Nele67-Bin004]|nr:MAG: hypothetical protein ATN35_03750 [Epulopiscium sp. Nele67-Bin004]